MASRHSGSLLLGREVLTGGLFGRLDLIRIVDTVLIAGSRLGGVEACLDEVLALGLRNKGLELWCREGVH